MRIEITLSLPSPGCSRALFLDVPDSALSGLDAAGRARAIDEAARAAVLEVVGFNWTEVDGTDADADETQEMR